MRGVESVSASGISCRARRLHGPPKITKGYRPDTLVSGCWEAGLSYLSSWDAFDALVEGKRAFCSGSGRVGRLTLRIAVKVLFVVWEGDFRENRGWFISVHLWPDGSWHTEGSVGVGPGVFRHVAPENTSAWVSSLPPSLLFSDSRASASVWPM